MMSSAPKSDGDSSSGFWRALRSKLFGDASGPTLREQIEDVIDDADDDAADRPTDGRAPDMSSIEREMLRNMLRFGELTADDVAVPRRDIIAINETASFEELVQLFAEADHSRLPVYRDKLDNVIGMIHVKDVFGILARGEVPPATLEPLLRQPLFVPQAMGALELLAEMRAQRMHLSIVVDEYAGTDGLVTIEDLMEEIVGNIEDEHDDAPEDLLVALGGGVWDGDARIELDELAERLDLRLAEVEGDVDTLGGLAFVLAGHVPQIGEVLTHASGWRIQITAGDERRVTRARLHSPGDAQATADG